jgi:excisionase family DNA binding protein
MPTPATTSGTPDGTTLDITFWTVAEAATLARTSKMTIYRLLHTGELESIRVGRSFRIPEPALTRYLTTPTTAQPEPASPAPGTAPPGDRNGHTPH